MTLATGKVVLFTDEPILLKYVELFAGGELFAADQTSETFDVENLVAGTTYQIGGQNAL
mgnify:CR=1 FL=1